jgi:hypothetical protein
MHHPRSRAERRRTRAIFVARRRNILSLSYDPKHPDELKPEDNGAWNRCSKWNLSCNCWLCLAARHRVNRRVRRDQLKRDVVNNLDEWGMGTER